jgi:hypothetical protein
MACDHTLLVTPNHNVAASATSRLAPNCSATPYAAAHATAIATPLIAFMRQAIEPTGIACDHT